MLTHMLPASNSKHMQTCEKYCSLTLASWLQQASSFFQEVEETGISFCLIISDLKVGSLPEYSITLTFWHLYFEDLVTI